MKETVRERILALKTAKKPLNFKNMIDKNIDVDVPSVTKHDIYQEDSSLVNFVKELEYSNKNTKDIDEQISKRVNEESSRIRERDEKYIDNDDEEIIGISGIEGKSFDPKSDAFGCFYFGFFVPILTLKEDGLIYKSSFFPWSAIKKVEYIIYSRCFEWRIVRYPILKIFTEKNIITIKGNNLVDKYESSISFRISSLGASLGFGEVGHKTTQFQYLRCKIFDNIVCPVEYKEKEWGIKLNKGVSIFLILLAIFLILILPIIILFSS